MFMKLLLHICCGPCSAACIKVLRDENIDVTGYWYNPNIQPYTEYLNRLDALKEYSKLINLKVIYNDYYNLKEFVDNVKNDLNNRCGYCYLSRLESAFKYASSNDYDCVTTTLLISPYQKHDLIIRTCEFLEKNIMLNFYIEILDLTFMKVKQCLRKLDYICRNIADVYLVKKKDMKKR